MKTASGLVYEPDLYMRVVALDAASARAFVGEPSGEPLDLGPASPSKYKDGARVWGFLSRPETAAERAHRIWTVASGGTVGT